MSQHSHQLSGDIYLDNYRYVAPLAGAWVETPHPERRRNYTVVAPLAGAWVETLQMPLMGVLWKVAPLAGAWVETY